MAWKGRRPKNHRRQIGSGFPPRGQREAKAPPAGMRSRGTATRQAPKFVQPFWFWDTSAELSGFLGCSFFGTGFKLKLKKVEGVTCGIRQVLPAGQQPSLFLLYARSISFKRRSDWQGPALSFLHAAR